MKICVLDASTLGEDLDLSPLSKFGEVKVYMTTPPEEVAKRIEGADAVIINKVKLGENNLCFSDTLKIICIAATGYDNIDVAYCRKRGIAVCNVAGYSTSSVAQITVSMALSLIIHLPEYTSFVSSGAYSESGVANRLVPVYHELAGKTWGIVGYGNIGKQVGKIASAFGCRVIVNKRTPVNDAECVSLETLCRESDIISLHVPLSDSTRGMINKDMISLMKRDAIIINSARGAVCDEAELAKAIKEGRLGALGSDVYSSEPFGKSHPFYEIKDFSNICLTPHMSWGAYEARVRCLEGIVKNIESFLAGGKASRVDLL